MINKKIKQFFIYSVTKIFYYLFLFIWSLVTWPIKLITYILSFPFFFVYYYILRPCYNISKRFILFIYNILVAKHDQLVEWIHTMPRVVYWWFWMEDVIFPWIWFFYEAYFCILVYSVVWSIIELHTKTFEWKKMFKMIFYILPYEAVVPVFSLATSHFVSIYLIHFIVVHICYKYLKLDKYFVKFQIWHNNTCGKYFLGRLLWYFEDIIRALFFGPIIVFTLRQWIISLYTLIFYTRFKFIFNWSYVITGIYVMGHIIFSKNPKLLINQGCWFSPELNKWDRYSSDKKYLQRHWISFLAYKNNKSLRFRFSQLYICRKICYYYCKLFNKICYKIFNVRNSPKFYTRIPIEEFCIWFPSKIPSIKYYKVGPYYFERVLNPKTGQLYFIRHRPYFELWHKYEEVYLDIESDEEGWFEEEDPLYFNMPTCIFFVLLFLGFFFGGLWEFSSVLWEFYRVNWAMPWELKLLDGYVVFLRKQISSWRRRAVKFRKANPSKTYRPYAEKGYKKNIFRSKREFFTNAHPFIKPDTKIKRQRVRFWNHK